MNRSNKKFTILGIDPGTRITGYGIISSDLARHSPIDFGCIRPPPKLPDAEKYLHIFEGISEILRTHPIDALSVETQFVYKNAQTALKLGMAKCAVLLAAAKQNIPVFEYAPKQAKLSVVGTGSASKSQVQKMIKAILSLKEIPTPEDAADGLSLAICHAHHMRLNQCMSM